jgi:DNA invertase Pin-like site-specific DNA recombinase
MKAILYARTSTDEQTNGIEAQRKRLTAEAKARGWKWDLREEHASAKTLARRPKLKSALEDLEGGRADVLMVTKLDRLARSTLDFATILERSRQKGWALVTLDLGLDTSTPNGEFAATVLMGVAQLERRLISERTREALAVVRASGKQLGHPSTVPATTRRRIVRLRDSGLSWRSISEKLNGDGVPGPAGGTWHSTSVRRVFDRVHPPH